MSGQEYREAMQAMESYKSYPAACRKNILKLMSALRVTDQCAYSMMLMTAALMDLRPEDDQVAEMILEDCGVKEPECA